MAGRPNESLVSRLDNHTSERGGRKQIEMRKFYTLGLAFAAVFAFCAVAATGASALEWLVDGNPVAAGGVEAISKSEGKSILLEDTATKTHIDCEGTDKGLVLPSGADTEETISVNASTQCEVLEAGECGTLNRVSGAHLGWNTQLEVFGGANVDHVVSGTGGNPGWEVECTTFFIKVTDTCTSTEGRPLVTNNANGTVDVEFMAGEPAALCSVHNGETGHVEGLVILEVPGKTLAVS